MLKLLLQHHVLEYAINRIFDGIHNNFRRHDFLTVGKHYDSIEYAYLNRASVTLYDCYVKGHGYLLVMEYYAYRVEFGHYKFDPPRIDDPNFISMTLPEHWITKINGISITDMA